MAEYDITMKQYNGSDYDNLYPKNVGQQVLLNDNELKNKLGITITNPTINDAVKYTVDNSLEFHSYTGTGTYGSANQNSIAFNFKPRFIYIISYDGWGCIMVNGSNNYGYSAIHGSGFYELTVSFSNNTINWYNSIGTIFQLNESNITYYVIGFK